VLSSVPAGPPGAAHRPRASSPATPAEGFFARHPGLLDDPAAAVDVVYSEALVREEFGEPAAADEYVRRFPALAEPLARQFELHALLGSALSSAPPAAGRAGATGLDAGPADTAVDGPPAPVPGFEVLGRVGAGATGSCTGPASSA